MIIFFDNLRQKIHKFQQGETLVHCDFINVSMSKVSISTAPTTEMSPDTELHRDQTTAVAAAASPAISSSRVVTAAEYKYKYK